MMYDILNAAIDAGTILPLVSAHAEEMYGAESNPDLNHFFTLINAGVARVFVAKENGRAIGYAAFVLHRDLFKAHVKQAECVAIYISPQYRGTCAAKRLFLFSEKMMVGHDDISRIISTTSNNPKLQAFYARLGFKVSNIQVTKEL